MSILHCWRDKSSDAKTVALRPREGQAFVEDRIGDQRHRLLANNLGSEILSARHFGRDISDMVGKP